MELTGGSVLASQHNEELFTPASNAKLYTTAFGLSRLGSAYRFTTQLCTTGPWTAGQKTIPDLQLVGGGDPNLSGRVLPYQAPARDAVETEDRSLVVLQELARSLKDKGIEAIDGPVTGVASRYPFQLYPQGWTVDDTLYSYGAPISSLTVNDSAATLVFEPTIDGELAALRIEPEVAQFVLLNEVTTGRGPTNIQIARPLEGHEIVVWGNISERAKPVRMDMAVDDPALFAAKAMIAVLQNEGISVRGEPEARYRPIFCDSAKAVFQSNVCDAREGTVLAAHQSAPLDQIVQVLNKVSQNLHAEMLLREAALHDGLENDPVKARELFLQSLGVEGNPAELRIEDGSGLSRADKVSPNATVRLLGAMWDSSLRETWLASLPIGGVDGTLQHRFHGVRDADHIHAKTGFLSNVNTLSGYVETHDHRWLAFSAMVDATVADDHDVRNFLDAFGALLVRQ